MFGSDLRQSINFDMELKVRLRGVLAGNVSVDAGAQMLLDF